MVSKIERLPEYWHEASAELATRCEVMRSLVEQFEGEMLKSFSDPFHTLARSIVGQQISVKAADSIWGRLDEGLKKWTPKEVLAAEESWLRSCGLSGQKVNYLRGLAQHFASNRGLAKRWDALETEELRAELLALKGIGPWTVEMYLIFHAMHPDVWPVGDVGLQKAVGKHYSKSGEAMKGDALMKAGKRFAPWRTVATWYLWRSLDPVPVQY